MSKRTIPEEVKRQVEDIVRDFNADVIRNRHRSYSTRYRGTYLYLDLSDYGRSGPVCRLKYNGGMDNWGFAIFKYSDMCYDADEWFFPGSEHIDGTVEGAMRAGLEAYS